MSLKFFILLACLSMGPACSNAQNKQSADQTLSGEYKLSNNQAFSAKIEWDSSLQAETYLTGMIRFKTSDDIAISSIAVSNFEPTMPSMGHGTSMESQVISEPESGSGIVKFSGVWFNMSGDWDIAITATINGRQDVVHLALRVP